VQYPYAPTPSAAQHPGGDQAHPQPGVGPGPGTRHDRVELTAGHARLGQYLPDAGREQFALAPGIDHVKACQHPPLIAHGNRYRLCRGIERKHQHGCKE
jgi:hypothetical protein